MKRKHFFITVFLLSVVNLFAFEAVPTEQLLLSYLQNDIDLQKLTIAAEKANLTYETSKIDSNTNIILLNAKIARR